MTPPDTPHPRLPALVRWIIDRLAPIDWRESIAGDLAEESQPRSAGGTIRLVVGALVACARLRWDRRRDAPRPRPGRLGTRGTVLLAEARGAIRSLLARPGTSGLALVTLTLGIGLTTSVFSLANWLMFRPVPGIGAPDRLLTIRHQSLDGSIFPVSGKDVTDLAKASALAALAGSEKSVFHVSQAADAAAARVDGEYVSVPYFDVLDQRLAAGRRFAAADAAAGPAANIVVVSDDFARATFGGDGAAVGRTLIVDRAPFQIVGVAAAGFHGPSRTDQTEIWMPVTAKQSARVDDSRTALFLTLLGRLRASATLAEARSQLEAIHRGEGRWSPRTPIKVEAGLAAPFWQTVRLTETFSLVWGVVALLLVLTSANVGNLMLARSIERANELATRQALGASRSRLALGLLCEALWLAAAGGVLSLVTARVVTRLLEHTVILRNMPALTHVEIAWPVFRAAVSVSTVVALTTALMPALMLKSVDLVASLKTTGRGPAPGRRRVRTALVVAQVAVTVTLAIGGLLLLRSMRARARVPLGFQPENVLAFSIDPGVAGNGGSADHEVQYFRRLLEDVRHIPGVASASLAWVEPFKFIGGGGALRPAAPVGATEIVTDANDVSPGFFDTLGIPLLAGRDFIDQEVFRSDERGGGVVILNAALAHALFGDRMAVGERVVMSYPEGRVRTVVGVVGDTRTRSLSGPLPLIYYEPFGQSFLIDWGTVHVRLTTPSSSVIPQVRAIVRALDPMLPPYDVEVVNDSLTRYLAEDVMLMRLTVAFALVALVLVAVGLYGVLARQIEERRHEFGVRLALGARPQTLGRLVTWEAGRALGWGSALGLVSATWLARLIATRLFGVSTVDPIALAAAVGLVMVATLVAALPVARRASRVDPADILRR